METKTEGLKDNLGTLVRINHVYIYNINVYRYI